MIALERTQEWAVYRPVGEFDVTNAAEIADAAAAVSNADLGLIIDLTRVTYIDSAAIRVLLAARRDLGHRRQQLRMVLPGDSLLRRTLDLTGVLALVAAYPSVADAVG